MIKIIIIIIVIERIILQSESRLASTLFSQARSLSQCSGLLHGRKLHAHAYTHDMTGS